MKCLIVALYTLMAATLASTQPAPQSSERSPLSESSTIQAEHIWGTLWRLNESTKEWEMNEVDCLSIAEELQEEVKTKGSNYMFFECPYPLVVNEDGSVEIATVVSKESS
jgi:hypothetical protein